jgi:hypothetical protein
MKLFDAQGHLTDATLLLMEDGELNELSLERAEAHLAGCSTCCQRQCAVHNTTLHVARTQQSIHMNGQEQARSRLHAAMNAAPPPEPARWWAVLLQPQAAMQMALVASVLVAGGLLLHLQPTAREDAGAVPDRILTPGAVRVAALPELCSLPDDDLDPVVSPEKQQEVFRAYHIQPTDETGYQVDYLVNPQLGGDSTIENLWPEPYSATAWDARAKDALETRLHAMVCSGQITLQAAQHDLSTDWIAAYKKYFHTTRPARTAMLDQPQVLQAIAVQP